MLREAAASAGGFAFSPPFTTQPTAVLLNEAFRRAEERHPTSPHRRHAARTKSTGTPIGSRIVETQAASPREGRLALPSGSRDLSVMNRARIGGKKKKKNRQSTLHTHSSWSWEQSVGLESGNSARKIFYPPRVRSDRSHGTTKTAGPTFRPWARSHPA
jgi:hypothetical protein